MSEYKKPLPAINATNRPFWDAARRHELVAWRCLNCGAYFSRVTDCRSCDNPKMDWVKVGGRGQVFTFCIFRPPFHPAWKDDVPYNVAYVQLDEGPLMVTNIVDCANEAIFIGMPVEVVFEDVTAEITLPKFKPVK
jgi:uncharacterized OB-fold protein